jgi:hypothetical protein
MRPIDNAIAALRLMQDACCRHLPIVGEARSSESDFQAMELDWLDEETGLRERIG